MKKLMVLDLITVVLVTAIFALSEMGYIDADRLADDIFEHPDVFRVPTVTTPDSHPVNTHKAGKDQ